MNSASFPQSWQFDGPAQPDWQQQFENWRELLDDCSRKPSRKRVHTLRTATLRLEAELEYWQRDRGPDNPQERPAKRWSKQADKLRKALSPVRDLDVYLEMLEGMRGPDRAGDPGQAGEKCQGSEACSGEIDKLERKLKQKREAGEKKLLAEIADRRARLERSSRQMQQVLADPGVRPWVDSAEAIRELIAGMAKDAPQLSADTLHDFRKQAKTGRYLAEFAAKGNEQAARQAVLLKKIQNAAGEWHDWQTLADRAQRYLGACEKQGLARLIESVADRALEKAMGKCRRLTAQLAEHIAEDGAQANPQAEKLPPKLAVKSAVPEAAPDQVRYA